MKTTALLLSTLLLTSMNPAFAVPKPNISPLPNAKNQVAPADDSELPSPQEVQQTAKKITVRITSEKNGGSGVLIAKKGSTYLVLTNAHVARRASQFQIQAPDGQKYTAKKIDGGFDAKYDLALLQFTSNAKYALADLTDVGSPLAPERTIYSAGFPFDNKDVRITSGQVTQLSDISFDDGTQIGYTIDQGKRGIRQGMSGGAILDGRGKFLGINTLSAAPIAPNYTYNDGSKPLPKLVAQYRRANWGVPVYNFLTRVKPDILYGYDNLPKMERQVTPTGFMARLNDQARKMTVRIEAGAGNGSGVVIAKEGNSYYVLTAKHVLQNLDTKQKFANPQIITYDQDVHKATSTVVAEGVDLAVVKFSSDNSYPLAQLGNYSPSAPNSAWVFVGGFPGRESIKSPLWQWQFNPGLISGGDEGRLITQDNLSFSNGYDLLYSNISYGGMSGGPVFDTDGNVIGIHGKAEATDNLMLGKSLGISTPTFMGLLPKLQLNPQLLKTTKNRPALKPGKDRNTVIFAAKNIAQPQANSSGENWLAYGNQLYRTTQEDKSVAAFDKAILKGEVLKGNYGKALSLLSLDQYKLSEVSINKAIAAVPKNKAANYYYFWKTQSGLLWKMKKYNESVVAINTAIQLNPNDLILRNEKAVILSSKKQFIAAIAILNEVIARDPGSYIFYSNRGNFREKSGDRKGAIVDYNQALKINSKYAIAYNNRGKAKLELQDRQGAIADYTQAIEIDSEFALAYSNRGLAKSSAGDFRGALADFNQAIKIDPKNAWNYNGRGLAKSSAGDKQGAIADFNQAIKIDPEFALPYKGRGLVKSAAGDLRGAMVDFNQAIKIDPQNALAYCNRGDNKWKLGDKQGAIADFNQAIKIDPKEDLAYSQRAFAKSQLGDQQGAIADYSQFIAIKPQDSVVYNSRGNSKLQLGDRLGAIADFTQAIKINPKFTFAYSQRAFAKLQLGDNAGAIVDYTRAIKIDSKNTLAYRGRGMAKSFSGDYQGTIADYSQVITIDPKDGSAYRSRGDSKLRLGDNAGAIADYTQAIKIDSKNTLAFNSRGLAKLQLKDEKGAIADFNQAIKINPQDSYAYFNLGVYKSKTGDKVGAIAYFNQAIKINPKDAAAYGSRGLAKNDLKDKAGAIGDTTTASNLFRQQGNIAGYQATMKELEKIKNQK